MKSRVENNYTENELSKIIFEHSLKIHKVLGPGLLESSYQRCLTHELNKVGLFVEVEKPLPLIYENIHLEAGYRVDIMVNKKVIIEIKSVESISDIHLSQLLTYLKLSDCKLGFLINFNVALIKNGFKRVANNL